MKWLGVVAGLLCWCGKSSAQFNDSVFHYIGFNAAGIRNKTTDASSYVLTNALKFNINKEKIALNAGAAWVYGRQNSKLINNDFSASADFNLRPHSHRFYYWGLANYDKNYSLKINNRLQAGLGAAYNFGSRPDASLNISEGVLYEATSLDLAGGTKDVYHTFRNSFRLRYRFVIYKIIILEGTNFLQNSLSYRQDYIIKATNGLSVKLNKWLNLTFSSAYNNLKRTGRQNLLLTFGLTAEKYF
jgi:hypothetical protein